MTFQPGPRLVDGSAINKVTSPATASQAGIVKQGVAVPNAAGANPTQAEYDGLLASLRTAGIIAT